MSFDFPRCLSTADMQKAQLLLKCHIAHLVISFFLYFSPWCLHSTQYVTLKSTLSCLTWYFHPGFDIPLNIFLLLYRRNWVLKHILPSICGVAFVVYGVQGGLNIDQSPIEHMTRVTESTMKAVSLTAIDFNKRKLLFEECQLFHLTVKERSCQP